MSSTQARYQSGSVAAAFDGADVLTLLAPPDQQVRLVGTTAGSHAAANGAEASRSVQRFRLPPPDIDVSAAGVAFGYDLGGAVAGADELVLDAVTVTVAGTGAADHPGISLGTLVSRIDGDALVVEVPAGRAIRALTVAGLAADEPDGPGFDSQDALAAADRRLTISAPAPAGGWAMPTIAIPPVPARGQLPAMLTGGSFTGGVLRLPDLTGRRLRISLVEGQTPDEFGAHPLKAGAVTGWAAPTPVDLTLTAPDGSVLFSFPGALSPGTETSSDVAVTLTKSLNTQRASGPMRGSLTLTSKFPARVGCRVDPVRGALIRRLPGTVRVELAGEPVTLAVPAPALDPAAPSMAITDLAVTYRGQRLADISDPLPPAGSRSGRVVRQDPVLRVLPPLALRGERVSRIGLVGWCPEPSALLVRLVTAPGSAAGSGAAIGRPGAASVPATTTPAVIWIDLPEPVTVEVPVAIEVSAGSGYLLWVGDPEGLVRIVVLDPDPGGRPILLGGSTLVTVGSAELRSLRGLLPTAEFAGPAAPVLASALLCTVELTDTELRYRRGG